MACICDARHLSEFSKIHSQSCEDYNRNMLDEQLRERLEWETQKKPCSGQGYAHKAHGRCPGFAFDRT